MSSTAVRESEQTTTLDGPHPSGDNRFKMLEATMKRHQYQPHSLIEVLHSTQEIFGFISNDLLCHVAHKLKLPLSRVYGVATFYHLFSLAPKGRHTCVVCMGTACYVKGAAHVVEAVEKMAGIRAGQTTPDGEVSLMTIRCPGVCGIAPVATFDGTVAGDVTTDMALERVKGWLSDDSDRTI